MIIHELAIGFLGTLSDVYQKADNQDMVMVQQLAGFVSRMVTTQMAFSDLAGGDNEALSHIMILERIDQCMSFGNSQGLTPEDKIRLTEITINYLDTHKDGNVMMHEFVEAVSSNDPINLKNTINLFDESRKAGILERMFTPDFLGDTKMTKYFPRREDGSYDVDAIYEEVQTQREKLADRTAGIAFIADQVSDAGSSHSTTPRRRTGQSPRRRTGESSSARTPRSIGSWGARSRKEMTFEV